MFHFPHWRRSAHVPLLIILEIIFIILFAQFVVYNPESVTYEHKDSTANAQDVLAKTYPMFQDVHVMIFIGFGFLMTFLKKYGLSAVSLNMLIAVISIQWATLVIGFFHLHYPDAHDHHHEAAEVHAPLADHMGHDHNTTMREGRAHEDHDHEHEHEHADPEAEGHHHESHGSGVIYLDLVNSMLSTDFASASVLISFGAVIGTTTPLQLIVMTLIEIVLFVGNEVIGRQKLGAVDAGDTIFVHLFGAYFGLAVSRVLHYKNADHHKNQTSGYTSDLFSMVGTVFLWMFWPSFNGAAAATGEAQHRAILNTYFSLCASVIAAFSISALLEERNKFVMEHIQNATLAGGVAIGAVADMLVQPYAALIIGSVAGGLSVFGYHYITPYLEDRFLIHDTCGVHNLHGMPAVIGTIISIIMAAKADTALYGKGLGIIYPALFNHTDHGVEVEAITAGSQALNQLFAALITMAFAIIGGFLTGLIIRFIGRWQARDFRKGATILKLAANVMKVTGIVGESKTGSIDEEVLPNNAYYDDKIYFHVHEEEEDEVGHQAVKPFTVQITNGGSFDPKKLQKQQKQKRASKATFSGVQMQPRLDLRGRLDLGGHMGGAKVSN